MPKVTKTCKVCGKQYTACCTGNWGVFRWQDVACCIECAQEYFRLVEESRSQGEHENETTKE